jgi:hypothetical protein
VLDSFFLLGYCTGMMVDTHTAYVVYDLTTKEYMNRDASSGGYEYPVQYLYHAQMFTLDRATEFLRQCKEGTYREHQFEVRELSLT